MFYVKLQNSSNQKQNGVTFTSDGISISVIDENMNFYASGKSSLSHLPRGTYNQISVDKQTVDRTNEWKFYQTRQCTLIEDECNWMQCQMNVVRTGKTRFCTERDCRSYFKWPSICKVAFRFTPVLFKSLTDQGILTCPD